MSIQEQTEKEIRRHLERQVERVRAAGERAGIEVDDEELLEIFAAEFLTGASQVIRWLIQNDGHPNFTPQIIERALVEVGKERGFEVG